MKRKKQSRAPASGIIEVAKARPDWIVDARGRLRDERGRLVSGAAIARARRESAVKALVRSLWEEANQAEFLDKPAIVLARMEAARALNVRYQYDGKRWRRGGKFVSVKTVNRAHARYLTEKKLEVYGRMMGMSKADVKKLMKKGKLTWEKVNQKLSISP